MQKKTYPIVISLRANSMNDAVRNALGLARETETDDIGYCQHYWHDSKQSVTYMVFSFDFGTKTAFVSVITIPMTGEDHFTVKIERVITRNKS